MKKFAMTRYASTSYKESLKSQVKQYKFLAGHLLHCDIVGHKSCIVCLTMSCSQLQKFDCRDQYLQH